MDRYQIVKSLGDGTYGTVFQAFNLKTQETVAIKKMKRKFSSWDECVSLNEINSLRKLTHPNIIKLKEVIKVNEELHLVFEFLSQNLYQLYLSFKNKQRKMGEPLIKSLIFQILSGLAHMHKHGFFHRDLKPENLMVEGKIVKLCDFGLAREIRARPPFTEYVSTRWYRAPEILLRSDNYNSPIDIFAVGCIMAELFLLNPLFPGSSEMDQLNKICSILGSPSSFIWPDCFKLASKIGFKFAEQAGISLPVVMRGSASSEAIELIAQMLQFDPQKRPSASQLLAHPFFDECRGGEKAGEEESFLSISKKKVSDNSFGGRNGSFLRKKSSDGGRKEIGERKEEGGGRRREDAAGRREEVRREEGRREERRREEEGKRDEGGKRRDREDTLLNISNNSRLSSSLESGGNPFKLKKEKAKPEVVLPKISEERLGFMKNSGLDRPNEIVGKEKEKSLLFPTLNKSKNSDFLFGSSNSKDQSIFSDKSQINMNNLNKKDHSLISDRSQINNMNMNKKDPFNFSDRSQINSNNLNKKDQAIFSNKNQMDSNNFNKNGNPILLPRKLDLNSDRNRKLEKNSFYEKINEKSSHNHSILEKDPNFNLNYGNENNKYGYYDGNSDKNVGSLYNDKNMERNRNFIDKNAYPEKNNIYYNPYEKLNNPVFNDKLERKDKFLSNNDRNILNPLEKNSFIEKQHFSLERAIEREKANKYDRYERKPERFEMYGNRIENLNSNKYPERNENKGFENKYENKGFDNKYDHIKQSYLPQNVLLPKMNKGYGGGFGNNHANLLNRLEYKEKAVFSMPPMGRGF